MDPNQPPRVLSGRYELSHLVARGGMAEVYRAHDRLLDRPVALKVLFPELSVDRSFVERFRREAQAAANLSHPNIVPVFDWGEDEGTYFIVMEFVDGRPLSSILRSAGPLHPDRAAEVGADVAGALSYAHRHGVVHRDVKPGNVLLTDEGLVKVTDFGIARAINTEESLTQTGAVMGTATYFSPEQAEGLGVDGRSDIYSLGVVLYEMVTGRPPFLGESPVAVASKHVRETPPAPRDVNPSVPPDFEAIIMKCMAKAPDYRYATGEDLRVDLLRFREGHAVAATPPPVATTAVAGPVTQVIDAPPMMAGGVSTVEEEELRSRTPLYVSILIVLLIALAVLIAFLGNSLGWWSFGTATKTFSLPNVVGKTVSEASSTLRGEGLKVQTQQQAGSNQPVTKVVGTIPQPGTKVHKGQTVTLLTGGTTSTVPAQVQVPDYTNQSVSYAQSDLSSKGLQSTVQYSQSCTQINIVCDQNPKGGTMVNPNSTVTLITAATATTTTAPSTVTVPTLTGDTPAAACNVLGRDGLNCGSQITQYSSSVPAGRVIDTNPPAGTVVSPNSSVDLYVSQGPAPTTTTASTTPTTASGLPPIGGHKPR